MPLPAKISGPVAVIGDVHGQFDKLAAIVSRLQALPDAENRWIVFIGDLVDRGPDSRAVLELVTDLIASHRRTAIVAGNHDFAMAAALKLIPTPEYSNWAERWLDHYDADRTFASYGASFGDLEHLKQQLPPAHAALLSDLPWAVEHSQYFFVHAGLDPNTPFELQRRILQRRDFSLNRPQWLCSKTLVNSEIPPDCRLTVVSGHVRVPAVEFRKRRILIDTTGGVDGELSCVLLPENRVITSGGGEIAEAAPVAAGRASSWRFWKR